MTDRNAAKQAFVAANGWANAASTQIAGDASNRKYDRLTLEDGATAVLMDAPPDRGENVRPFVQIAEYLANAGLSAPKVLAKDEALGFLLLEDLGDDLFARVLEKRPELETEFYTAAVDLLVKLHQETPPSVDAYSPDLTSDLACLSYDWYARGTLGIIDENARSAAHASLFAHLSAIEPTKHVLIQRDYHAENLLWLPDRTGAARVGLLDFQDARLGHPAYDLMSVLQDARRDVDPQVQSAMVDHYIAATGTDEETFKRAFATLGVQRNMRIMGVFARLCLRDRKTHYLDLIPRVWAHLETDLQHPDLSDLAEIIRASLPAPTPEILQQLKDKCGTFQPQP